MFASEDRPGHIRESTVQVAAGLFLWHGGGVVLLGEVAGDRWIVARGWLGPDMLTDVRRWTFTTPESFGAQIRRLALDATGSSHDAREAGAAATRWGLAAT